LLCPAALLAFAYPLRRKLESGPGGRTLLVLYGLILAYCGFWLGVPLLYPDAISFALVTGLAAVSTIGFLTTGFSLLSNHRVDLQAPRKLRAVDQKDAGQALE
jgi:hypothetical protein